MLLAHLCFCFSFSFVAVMTYSDENNLRRRMYYGSQFQRGTLHHGGEGTAAGAGSWPTTHTFDCQEANRKVRLGYKASRPVP